MFFSSSHFCHVLQYKQFYVASKPLFCRWYLLVLLPPLNSIWSSRSIERWSTSMIFQNFNNRKTVTTVLQYSSTCKCFLVFVPQLMPHILYYILASSNTSTIYILKLLYTCAVLMCLRSGTASRFCHHFFTFAYI